MISATTPAPTVLPPSRIANLVPFSSATGATTPTVTTALNLFGSDWNTIVVNPFSHPRVLFSDFEVGEKLLQHVFDILNEAD